MKNKREEEEENFDEILVNISWEQKEKKKTL